MTHDDTAPTPPPGPPAETETEQHEQPLDSAAEHADSAGHGVPDDHGHGAESLGPIDIAAWAAGLVGIAVGIATLLAFALSTGALS